MKRSIRRKGALRRKIVLGALAVVTVGAVVAGGFAWQKHEQAQAVASAECVVELAVDVQCEGWTPQNAELGVFVSGTQSDGSPCDLQLMFAGSGRQIAYVSEGSYEIVPQLPCVMLQDGNVLVASDAVARAYTADEMGSDGVVVAYVAADAESLSEDELAEAAAVSFPDESDASQALDRARAKREAGEGDA